MKKIFLLLPVIIIFLILPIRSYATQPGITVIPSETLLDLATDPPQTTIYYINSTDHTVQVTLSAKDFAPLEQNYTINYLSQNNDQNYSYKLSSWITFSQNSFILEPNQKMPITLYITAHQLTPGGHYASVIAAFHDDNASNTDLQVQGMLSSLVFVRANTGKEVDKASIDVFTTGNNFISFPTNDVIDINNQGNTFITPYGTITINDMFGNLVAKGIINENSLVTLPESFRSYTTPLRMLTPFQLPGIYHLTLSLQYGKKPETIILQQNFITFASWEAFTVALVLFITVLFFIRQLVIYFRVKK